jgi:hypothetical protein
MHRLSRWCCRWFMPLHFVGSSSPGLEASSVLHDGPEGSGGLHILLFFDWRRERRRAPATNVRAVSLDT